MGERYVDECDVIVEETGFLKRGKKTFKDREKITAPKGWRYALRVGANGDKWVPVQIAQ